MLYTHNNAQQEAYHQWLLARGLSSPKVRRVSAKPSTQPQPIALNSTTKVYLFFVLKEAELKNPPSKDLLKKMITATKIDLNQFLIVSHEALSAKLELFSPRHSVYFGATTQATEGDLVLPSLQEVLAQPGLKASIWKQLQELMARPDFPQQT